MIIGVIKQRTANGAYATQETPVTPAYIQYVDLTPKTDKIIITIGSERRYGNMKNSLLIAFINSNELFEASSSWYLVPIT